jgi:hypothetical protein
MHHDINKLLTLIPTIMFCYAYNLSRNPLFYSSGDQEYLNDILSDSVLPLDSNRVRRTL